MRSPSPGSEVPMPALLTNASSRDSLAATSSPRRRADLGGCRVELRAVAAVEKQRGAVRRERGRRGAAEAVGGPGDEDDLLGQGPHGCAYSSPFMPGPTHTAIGTWSGGR